MRLSLGTFSRYRPRALTVVVLAAIATLIMLVNLVESPGEGGVAYGWPLIWHWHAVIMVPPIFGVAGWNYSGAKLCANAALWLLILAAACGVCEWLLRRHPPRICWSLKTMLAAIALIAAFCAWFAAARNRARIHDEIISLAAKNGGTVYFDCWGPKWLDLVGADRFLRRIIGVSFTFRNIQEEHYAHDVAEDLENFERLTHLLDMHQLRILQICFEFYGEPGERQEGGEELHAITCVLAIVGNLTQLEEVGLEGPVIMSDRLDCLAHMTNLKFLDLSICDPEPDESGDGGRPSLSHLPVLAQLESLKLGGWSVGDNDLRQLAVLPRLKSLDLDGGWFTDAGLAELAPLDSLEELEIGDAMVSAAGLESLGSLKRLKAIHIDESYREADGKLPLDHGDALIVSEKDVAELSRALRELRQSRPGIVIAINAGAVGSPYSHGEALPDRGMSYVRQQGTFPFLPAWLGFQQ